MTLLSALLRGRSWLNGIAPSLLARRGDGENNQSRV